MSTQLLTAQAMEEQISRRLAQSVRLSWTEETDSTNDDAKRAALAGTPAVAIFGAERQHSGRGRLERHWQTGGGASVEMSFLFRPHLSPADLPAINFAVALGVCAGLEAVSGVQAEVKWPNDVLVDGAKICGILSESSLAGGQVEYVVTGAGINVNQAHFSDDLPGAASLRMLIGRPLSRAEVAAACIDAVLDRVRKLEEDGWERILDEYRRRSAVLGRQVEIVDRDGILRGRCIDFETDGAIVVDMGHERRRFYATDVSLRGAGLHV